MEETKNNKATAVYVALEPNEAIQKKIIHDEKYGPYSMVGKCKRSNTRTQYMDIFDRLLVVSKKAAHLWNELKENSDKDTNIVVMHSFNDLDKSTMGTTYRRLVELKEQDLIRKVIPFELPNEDLPMLKSLPAIPEMHSYMINPYLLRPWKYNLAKQIWDLIKPDKQIQVKTYEDSIEY